MSDTFSSALWVCRVDARTQRRYYVNRRTGRSTWEPAVARVAEASDAAPRAAEPAVDTPASPLSLTTTEAAPSPSSSQLVRTAEVESAAHESRADLSTLVITATAPDPSLSGSADTSTRASSSTATPTPAPLPPSSSSKPQSSPERSTSIATPPARVAVCVPRSASASFSDVADAADATPLGTSPLPRSARFSKSDASHSSSFLLPATDAAAVAAGRPPLSLSVEAAFPSEKSSLSSYSRQSAASPLQRVTTACDPRNASEFSSPTQRPSDRVSFSSSATQQRQVPPPLPMPYLVDPEPLSTAAAQPTQPTQERGEVFDQEAAAAEEWRLTRRTWELEEERATLESELAVLRGPVEVEAQSIAEEHSRLLETQRALETAVTLAMHQQATKEEEVNGLRRRLAELEQQRDISKTLIASLQERHAVLTERHRSVQDEVTRLTGQRQELEDMLLPSEEAALQAAQSRLCEQRRLVAERERQVHERDRLLTQSRSVITQLRHRLDGLQALLYRNSESAPHTALPSSPPLAPHNRNQLMCLKLTASRDSASANALSDAEGIDSMQLKMTKHGREARSRIAELEQEVSSFENATQSLHANAVLAAQKRALQRAAAWLRDTAETRRPTLAAASSLLHALEGYYETQCCKYGMLAESDRQRAARDR